MVKMMGKAMAEQLHKAAEEVSINTSKNINYSKTFHQVGKQKHSDLMKVIPYESQYSFSVMIKAILVEAVSPKCKYHTISNIRFCSKSSVALNLF
jgi:hypothetical protein